MNKQNVINPYNGIYLCNKKKTTDTSNHLNDSQKHYAELKKPETKQYLLYEFIYIKFLKINIIYSDKRCISGIW